VTAEANADLAKSTDTRWKGLLATDSVSKQDADEKAGDDAAKAAALQSARANVARLHDLESFKRVVAPFAGIVTSRTTDIGALINAGQSSGAELFRVAETSKLRIYVQVPQPYAGYVIVGQKADMSFDDRPGHNFTATVVRTAHAIDPSARTLQTELEYDNSKGELLPGAYAEVHLKLPTSVASLRLPANTLLFRTEGMQVGVVDADKHVKLASVTLGRDFGTQVEILGGVSESDSVIVNPPDSLRDGASVRLAPPPQNGQPPGAKSS
jgi:RND family efflux transporter MFP subunit